ncbi:MAG: hypothetical protein HY677_03745 [Chloroflexi bacterium]|nr:hypothetical protein [Chloroflexota bacterium]
MNSLRGYLIHDGAIDPANCRLLLVGEQPSPASGGIVLSSDDMGNSLQLPTLLPQALHLRRIVSGDLEVAWLVGDTRDGRGLLARTKDGGKTWQEKPLPSTVNDVSGLAFTQGKMWAVGQAGSDGVLLSSTDGGDTWKEVLRLPAQGGRSARFTGLASADPTIVSIGTDGVQGVILVSHDSGNTFKRLTGVTITAATGLALVDTDHVYVSGYHQSDLRDETSRKYVLLVSKDGGNSFDPISVPAPFVGDVWFSSPRHGFLIGAASGGPAILETNDGGSTWQAALLKTAPFVSGLERLFGAANFVYGVGGAGLFVRASDSNSGR